MNREANDNHPIRISITAGSVIRVVIAFLLVVFLYYVRDIVLTVLVAVVIASAVEPMVKWLDRHKIRRVPAVISIYALLAIIFFFVIYFFLPVFLDEVAKLVASLPKYITYTETLIPSKNGALIGTSPLFQQFTSSSFSASQFIDNISTTLTSTSQGLLQTVSFIFGGVLSFILIIVLSFYLAVQEDGISAFLRIISPARYEKYVVNLWKRSEQKIGFWMQGQLLLSVTVGVLVFLTMTIFGVSHALILGFLAAVLEIIPVFGPIMFALPGILIALGEKGIVFALVIAAVYIVIQQFESNLFYPLVVKKIVGISPLLVIIALVIGAKLGGFLGILLSVPVAGTLVEYMKDLENDKIAATDRREQKDVIV
jgi:predicted PurR-regulated permease PerM